MGSQGGQKILRIYDRAKAAAKIASAKSEGRIVYYIDEPHKGSPIPTVWDMPNLGAKERSGWRTQKSLALYSRMILASSNPGDVVFDPFCGCATTLVAAENAGRQWVGIDRAEEAEEQVRIQLGKLNENSYDF